MRRTLRAVIGVGTIAFTACHGGSTTEPPPPPPGPPTLSIGHDTTLLVDEALAVPVEAREADGRQISNPSITWRSSAPTVASVDASGHVIALALGTATLTATMDGIDAQTVVTVAPQFTQIATGDTHTCGITGRNEIYCWGISLYGELEPASDLQDCSARFGAGVKCSPVPVRSLDIRAVAITAGFMHTCALDANGTAFCWGPNHYGEAGTGSQSPVLTPTPVAGDLQFIQITAGQSHTCGITTSHEAYCWGRDRTGELGGGHVAPESCTFDRTYPCSRTPQLVAGSHEWAQLSTNDRATCGITTSGELYCWGLDVGGNDGLFCQEPGILTGCTHTPIRIASPNIYKAVSIGGVHHCEQAPDDTIDCWGANYWGMFGDGTTGVGSPTPVPAGGGVAYASLQATRNGTCALTEGGRAQCWGHGNEGQIGNGALEDALTPADVSGGHLFVVLTSNGISDFTCGIADTGRAYCWGWGVYAQLGDGGFVSKSEPSLIRLVADHASAAAERS